MEKWGEGGSWEKMWSGLQLFEDAYKLAIACIIKNPDQVEPKVDKKVQKKMSKNMEARIEKRKL